MKQGIKNLFALLIVVSTVAITMSSCQKSGSFDSYFYLTQNIGGGDPATTTITVDKTNYGTIQYLSGTITTQSSGLNHIKLPYGRHNYTVYDVNKKAIISGYIEQTGDMSGSGSWGPAGGGDSCVGTSNGMLVGLFR